MVGSSTFTQQKGRNNREKAQNRVGRKNKFAGSSCKVKKQQLAKRVETKAIKADQETKEKLDRSANSPTPEMPGMHQPSTFSRKKLVSIFIYIYIYIYIPDAPVAYQVS